MLTNAQFIHLNPSVNRHLDHSCCDPEARIPLGEISRFLTLSPRVMVGSTPPSLPLGQGRESLSFLPMFYSGIKLSRRTGFEKLDAQVPARQVENPTKAMSMRAELRQQEPKVNSRAWLSGFEYSV